MTISYNVQHCPMGAFASFTMGHFGTRGGLACERGRPADSNMYVGYQREGDPEPSLLPFFEPPSAQQASFQATANTDVRSPGRVIPEREITRHLSPATDEWSTGPLTVRVISPFIPIADPVRSSEEEQRLAACPAVFVQLILDNRDGERAVRAHFGIEDETCRVLDDQVLRGFAVRDRRGMAVLAESSATSFLEFGLPDGLLQAGRRLFRLGRTAGFVVEARPGERVECVVALAVYQPGEVTTGLRTRYWYTRLFPDLEAVLAFALQHFEVYRAEAARREQELGRAGLSAEQRFLISHATHSYFGSTAWLDCDGEPLWVVNEGEYVMLNTLDLSVDQAFFELRYFPWAVRSVLESFARFYSYHDTVFRPGAPEHALPGGVSFCHDQGVANQFSPPGHSSYELADVPASCFSYMSYEELTNWVLTAGLYFARTQDRGFLQRWQPLIGECLVSLQNRDDPDPERRTGVMGCDGSRTGTGAEITTYDSLDSSLGQARNNLYLAGKTWAASLTLELLFQALGDDDRAAAARAAAELTARTIAAHWDEKLGYIPAVFEGGNRSAIIPAIEALVYPQQLGLSDALREDGPYGEYLSLLRRHFVSVFRPGVCQFPDGGWKLSSTSDNSWLSKIAIAQYVARRVLGVAFSEEEAARHDRAHADWQRLGSGYWACSDQFVSGVALGSRYYPRCVTTWLWCDE